MELTVSIKEQSKIAAFLTLIRKMDYVDIIDVKESSDDLPIEHRDLLEDRLRRIKGGKTEFKSWDLIKQKYENKQV